AFAPPSRRHGGASRLPEIAALVAHRQMDRLPARPAAGHLGGAAQPRPAVPGTLAETPRDDRTQQPAEGRGMAKRGPWRVERHDKAVGYLRRRPPASARPPGLPGRALRLRRAGQRPPARKSIPACASEAPPALGAISIAFLGDACTIPGSCQAGATERSR